MIFLPGSSGLTPGALAGPILNVELFADPGFDTPAAWTATAPWVVSGGKAAYDDTTLNYITPVAVVPLAAGVPYRFIIELADFATPGSGSMTFGLFNQNAGANLLGGYQTVNTLGNHQYDFTPTANATNVRIYGNTSSSGIWSALSVSLKRIA